MFNDAFVMQIVSRLVPDIQFIPLHIPTPIFPSLGYIPNVIFQQTWLALSVLLGIGVGGVGFV